jgi:hypothetical protein
MSLRTPAVLVLVAASAFSACSGRPAASGGTSAPLLATTHAPGQGHATSPSPDAAAANSAALTPPQGVTTIADLWKTRAMLAGTIVTVRGKVVKYNGGILGVNWMHLQDGTGAASDRTNDMTVTSEMETKVGDVITATGVVAVDKDLGSGYNYPVIIEHATIAPR